MSTTLGLMGGTATGYFLGAMMVGNARSRDIAILLERNERLTGCVREYAMFLDKNSTTQQLEEMTRRLERWI